MKLVTKMALGALLALAMTASTGDASAANNGLVIDTAILTPTVRLNLKSDIDRAKLKNMAAFKAVNEVALNATELDKASRRPGAPLTNSFKALGPDALMPMLEMLAVEQSVPANQPPTARLALEHGLIEAVGLLKDAKALPILTGILAKTKDAQTTFMTAEAIARLGSDDAVATLTAALKGADVTRSRAIYRGLGACRRLASIQAISSQLDSHPDAESASILAKSLGHAGNAWGWKAGGNSAEEGSSRDLAARSLMKAFVGYEGETRIAAQKALLVVDAGVTKQLIADARKGASPSLSAALDDLAERFASNPSR